jgi:hypothetical protein
MSLLEFKVLVSAAACAVKPVYLHQVLSTLFINNEVLVPTTKFKVPPSHCLLIKAVFQVAALVILASG